MGGTAKRFRPAVVGGSDRLWLMAQHIATKAPVRLDRARALAGTMDQGNSNLARTQALVGAGMSLSSMNAFLVRFGFNNPDARYVQKA